MPDLIRILIVADVVEEARRLEEIFLSGGGFVVAGSYTPTNTGRRTVADVIVIRSQDPSLQPASRKYAGSVAGGAGRVP